MRKGLNASAVVAAALASMRSASVRGVTFSQASLGPVYVGRAAARSSGGGIKGDFTPVARCMGSGTASYTHHYRMINGDHAYDVSIITPKVDAVGVLFE